MRIQSTYIQQIKESLCRQGAKPTAVLRSVAPELTRRRPVRKTEATYNSSRLEHYPLLLYRLPVFCGCGKVGRVAALLFPEKKRKPRGGGGGVFGARVFWFSPWRGLQLLMLYPGGPAGTTREVAYMCTVA